MVFSIDRRGQRSTLATRIEAVGFGAGPIAVIFGSVLWVLIPWLCFAIAFWVTGVRIRDPRAWILLGILLGIGELTRAPILDPRGWADIGVAVRLYHQMAVPAWSICMMLFGIYFPQRWRFDRRFPWIKWMIGAPLAAVPLWYAAADAIASINYTAAAPLSLNLPAVNSILTALSFIAPCFFFIGLSDKYRDGSLAPGDRRRIKLLYLGTTAAMTPLFLLTLYSGIFHHRLPQDDDLALALLPLLLFPLTMAYVMCVCVFIAPWMRAWWCARACNTRWRGAASAACRPW